MSAGTLQRDRFRAIAHRVRAIPGERFGLRPHTVSLVTATWSGAVTGEGVETTTTTEIIELNGQPPKCRWLRGDEVAIGGLAAGTVDVGPITPELGASLDALNVGALATGGTRHLLITGPNHPTGAKYRIIDIDSSMALHYMIRAVPVSQ